ncbi:MAG: MFS transporter [Anaerolineales bacterium]
MDTHPETGPAWEILVFPLIRGVLNTGFRMVYPFLPAISRALGMSIESVALAITARSLIGISGPLVGSAGDRIGRRRAMLLGLLLFAGGCLLVSFWPTYPGLLLALLLGAVGKIIFDPAMQAYLGDSIEYGRRGRAIAITEFGWSGAALIGLPLSGWLIARAGWMSPFGVLGLLGLGLALVLMRVLPDARPSHLTPYSLRHAFAVIRSNPTALAALGIAFLLSSGNEVVNIIYGVWLERSFGLQVAALGAASAVIGLAELTGEGVVALWTDRIGKRRAVGLGLLLIALTCLTLPLTRDTLIGALIGLFFFYITFEYTFVSLISLVTEVTPASRATLMAGNITAAAAGRALGATSGPVLFKVGLMANGTAAALAALLSLLLLARFVRLE